MGELSTTNLRRGYDVGQLQSYITRYGPVAGPKLYHAVRSRSAYMGANARRRATIARLSAKDRPVRHAAVLATGGGGAGLLPFGPDLDSDSN